MRHSGKDEEEAILPRILVVPPGTGPAAPLFILPVPGADEPREGNNRVSLPWIHVLLLSALPAAGQEVSGPADPSGSLAALLASPVKVASRRPQPWIESPVAVEVITGDELRRLGVHRLHEALRLLTSVDLIEASPVGVSLGFRSILPQGNPLGVQILIDGVPLSTSGSFHPIDLDNLPVPLDLIERVEIARGPCSSLYGPNAVTGVVSIQTSGDTDRPGGSARISGASHGTARGAGTLRLWGGPWTFLAGASRFTVGDPGTSPYRVVGGAANPATLPPGRDVERQNQAFGRLDYKRADWSVWALAGYARKTYGADVVTAAFLETPAQGSTLDVAQWGLRWSMTKSVEITVRGHRVDERIEAGPQPLLAVLDPGFSHEGHVYDQKTSYIQEMQLDWRPSETFRTTVGLDHRHLTAPASVILGFPRSLEIHTTGSFLDLEWRFDPSWILSSGLRVDNSALGGSTLAPRAVLTWLVRPESVLRFGYSTASRSPALSEAYVSTPAASIIPNPDLKPERARSWELGWRRDWLPLVVDLTLYATRFDENLVFELFPGPYRQYVNGPGGSARGVELSLLFEPAAGRVFGFNLNVGRRVDERTAPGRGDIPTYAPPGKANLWFRGRQGPWSGYVAVQYVGSAWVNGFSLTSPGGESLENRSAFVQLHGRAGRAFGKGLTLSAYLSNGARAFTPQGVGGLATTVFMRGASREAGLTLEGRW